MQKELTEELGELVTIKPIVFMGDTDATAWDILIEDRMLSVVYYDSDGRIRSVGSVFGVHASVKAFAMAVRARIESTKPSND